MVKLVMIPGTVGDQHLFSKVAPFIPEEIAFTTLNHLGVGNFPDLVDSYHELLRGMGEIVLGGTSVGGWIAQHYATRYPDNIQGLVLGNTFSDNSRLRKKNLWQYRISKLLPQGVFISMMIANTRKSLEDLPDQEKNVEYLSENIRTMGKKELRRRLSWSLAKISPPSPDPDLPKLVIYTKDDNVVDMSLTEMLIARYPEADVRVIEMGGHFPYLAFPREYADHLTSFLKALS